VLIRVFLSPLSNEQLAKLGFIGLQVSLDNCSQRASRLEVIGMETLTGSNCVHVPRVWIAPREVHLVHNNGLFVDFIVDVERDLEDSHPATQWRSYAVVGD